jgi:hypothetical protein
MRVHESAERLECSFGIMEPGLPKRLMSTRFVSKRRQGWVRAQSTREGHPFCAQWIPRITECHRAGLKIPLEPVCR